MLHHILLTIFALVAGTDKKDCFLFSNLNQNEPETLNTIAIEYVEQKLADIIQIKNEFIKRTKKLKDDLSVLTKKEKLFFDSLEAISTLSRKKYSNNFRNSENVIVFWIPSLEIYYNLNFIIKNCCFDCSNETSILIANLIKLSESHDNVKRNLMSTLKVLHSRLKKSKKIISSEIIYFCKEIKADFVCLQRIQENINFLFKRELIGIIEKIEQSWNELTLLQKYWAANSEYCKYISDYVDRLSVLIRNTNNKNIDSLALLCEDLVNKIESPKYDECATTKEQMKDKIYLCYLNKNTDFFINLSYVFTKNMLNSVLSKWNDDGFEERYFEKINDIVLLDNKLIGNIILRIIEDVSCIINEESFEFIAVYKDFFTKITKIFQESLETEMQILCDGLLSYLNCDKEQIEKIVDNIKNADFLRENFSPFTFTRIKHFVNVRFLKLYSEFLCLINILQKNKRFLIESGSDYRQKLRREETTDFICQINFLIENLKDEYEKFFDLYFEEAIPEIKE